MKIRGLKTLDLTKNFLNFDHLSLLKKSENFFIEELNLSRNIISDKFPSNFFQNLLILNLSNNKIDSSAISTIAFNLRGNTTKWQKLNLNKNFIRNEGFENLINSLTTNKTLISLKVANNELDDSSLLYLSKKMEEISLVEIDISENYFSPEIFIRLFSHKKRKSNVNENYLKNIICENNNSNNNSELNSLLDNSFDESENYVNFLEELKIKNSSNLAEILLKEFNNYFLNLKVLNIEKLKKLEAFECDLLSDYLEKCYCLKELNISNIGLGKIKKNETIKKLSESIGNLTHLIDLNISKNKLGNHIGIFLQSLNKGSLINLKKIDLSSNNIENNFGDKIAEFLEYFNLLEECILSDNSIGFYTFSQINRVLICPKNRLKILRLSNTLLTCDDFLLFAKILELTTSLQVF